MSQRQTFNMFWEGQSLTPIETLCMRSFVNCGHDLTVFSYNGAQVPQGVALEDARQVLPADRYFTFEDSPVCFHQHFSVQALVGSRRMVG
jgi:hypothetical protein